MLNMNSILRDENGKIFNINGWNVGIEVETGQYRQKDGKRPILMPAHYGEFTGTVGADGDAIDCYIGEHIGNNMVYVINQQKHDGSFDEHKVMLFFADAKHAVSVYKMACHNKEPLSVVACTFGQLAWWMTHGNTQTLMREEVLPFDSMNEESENMNNTVLDSLSWSDGNEQQDVKANRQAATKALYSLCLLDSIGQLTEPDNQADFNADVVASGGEFIFDESGAILDALVIQNKQLQRKMAIMQKLFNRHGGDELAVVEEGLQISEPFKQNNTTNIAAMFTLTDGQTITVFFHNPDATPKKLTADDNLVSWRWRLNKKDVTIVVAKENGQDQKVETIAKKMMALAVANKAKFAKANAQAAEKEQKIAETDLRIEAKRKELADLVAAIETAKGGVIPENVNTGTGTGTGESGTGAMFDLTHGDLGGGYMFVAKNIVKNGDYVPVAQLADVHEVNDGDVLTIDMQDPYKGDAKALAEVKEYIVNTLAKGKQVTFADEQNATTGGNDVPNGVLPDVEPETPPQGEEWESNPVSYWGDDDNVEVPQSQYAEVKKAITELKAQGFTGGGGKFEDLLTISQSEIDFNFAYDPTNGLLIEWMDNQTDYSDWWFNSIDMMNGKAIETPAAKIVQAVVAKYSELLLERAAFEAENAEENGNSNLQGKTKEFIAAAMMVDSAAKRAGMDLSWGDFNGSGSGGLFDSLNVSQLPSGVSEGIVAQFGKDVTVFGRVEIDAGGVVSVLHSADGDTYIQQGMKDITAIAEAMIKAMGTEKQAKPQTPPNEPETKPQEPEASVVSEEPSEAEEKAGLAVPYKAPTLKDLGVNNSKATELNRRVILLDKDDKPFGWGNGMMFDMAKIPSTIQKAFDKASNVMELDWHRWLKIYDSSVKAAVDYQEVTVKDGVAVFVGKLNDTDEVLAAVNPDYLNYFKQHHGQNITIHGTNASIKANEIDAGKAIVKSGGSVVGIVGFINRSADFFEEFNGAAKNQETPAEALRKENQASYDNPIAVIGGLRLFKFKMVTDYNEVTEFFATEDTNSTGEPQGIKGAGLFKSEEDARFSLESHEKNTAFQKEAADKAKAKAEREKQAYEDMIEQIGRDYLSKFTPAGQALQLKQLTKMAEHNGKRKVFYEYIQDLVAQGAYIINRPDKPRFFARDENGSIGIGVYQESKGFNKSQMDYAEWVVRKNGNKVMNEEEWQEYSSNKRQSDNEKYKENRNKFKEAAQMDTEEQWLKDALDGKVDMMGNGFYENLEALATKYGSEEYSHFTEINELLDKVLAAYEAKVEAYSA